MKVMPEWPSFTSFIVDTESDYQSFPGEIGHNCDTAIFTCLGSWVL